MVPRLLTAAFSLLLLYDAVQAAEEPPRSAQQGTVLPPLQPLSVKSSLDGTQQPSLAWIPDLAKSEPRPLLIFLHSWSADCKQNNSAWQAEAVRRNWIYLHPNFRGPNFTPQAGGSPLAQQDILDAIDAIRQTCQVDPQRIYLAGTSGGGHMALQMAGRFPKRFSAVTAWVPISDLAEWYHFHTKSGVSDNYAKNVVSLCGGVPGESKEIDQQYRDRSPVTWLGNVGDLPVDINAGVHDGHSGSVPVAHSLKAFNVIATAHKTPLITDQEMDELWTHRKLLHPQPQDTASDEPAADGGTVNTGNPPLKLFLRRTSGSSRVTIFDGGHVGHPAPACQWLEKQSRNTETSTK